MIYKYAFLTFKNKTMSLFSVIPAKPMNLSVINKTSNSATLYWELPFPLQSFPPGITHKIMYQNQWDHKKDWEVRSIYYTISGIFYLSLFSIFSIHWFIVIICSLRNNSNLD